jgi:hypothetical protein
MTLVRVWQSEAPEAGGGIFYQCAVICWDYAHGVCMCASLVLPEFISGDDPEARGVLKFV